MSCRRCRRRPPKLQTTTPRDFSAKEKNQHDNRRRGLHHARKTSNKKGSTTATPNPAPVNITTNRFSIPTNPHPEVADEGNREQFARRPRIPPFFVKTRPDWHSMLTLIRQEAPSMTAVMIQPLPPPSRTPDFSYAAATTNCPRPQAPPAANHNNPLDESSYEFLTILLRLARDNSLNADGIFAVVIDLIPELEALSNPHLKGAKILQEYSRRYGL
ncbi:hypothetical protein CEXT_94681 [Caerostris extrusa]|uniref:Uncharacterized protein n=1 Tax=Caerostris extrusa TaxID=172846 RepID=A0AAV4NS74_CAEEX|nr:hypothetical protein CEXT_94681 [Caerostris extrusa]